MTDYEYSKDAEKAIEWCRRVIMGCEAQGKTPRQMVETIDKHWRNIVHSLDSIPCIGHEGRK